MITFYIVRHGQKEAIPFDPPLTSLGQKQAEFTTEALKEIAFKEILASPKRRAQQTAEIIAKPHKLNITIDPRLQERMEWENNESFDEFLKEWDKTDLDRNYQSPKGISSNANGEQVRSLLEEQAKIHGEGNILLVTHGGTIGDLLRNIFTENAIEHTTALSGAKSIEVTECSITTIELNDGKYTLLKLADISHLPIPLI